MTFRNVRYAANGSINAERAGVQIGIPNDIANADYQAVIAWEADGNTIAPYEPSVGSDAVIVLYPADLWRRASDEEAVAIDEAMQTQPLRLRRIFQNAQTFQSNDELWPLLFAAAVDLFGDARARQLLATSLI